MWIEKEIAITVEDLAILHEIIGQERRMEYENNWNTINNLKGEENLIVFN